MLSAKPLLIETMRVDTRAEIPLLAFHLRRLKTSAEALAYSYDEPNIRAAIKAQLQHLQGAEFRLRLTLSAEGQLNFEQGQLLPIIEPVSLLISHTPVVANPWLLHKTTNRQCFAQATQTITQYPSVFDVIFFNEQDQLCEGSRSNVYVLKDGLWLTPPVDCGLLGGVKRAQLLATEQVQIATITKAEFLEAKAIRVSNALRGWLNAKVIATPTALLGTQL